MGFCIVKALGLLKATASRGVPMNIWLVGPKYFPEDGGGIGTYVHDLAEGLVARGHTVTVVCQTDGPDQIGDVAGVRVVRVGRRDFPVGRLDAYVPGLWWSRAVARLLAQSGPSAVPDVVEFPNYGAMGFWQTHFGRRMPPTVVRLSTPLFEVLDLRGGKPTVEERLGCWMERRAVQRGQHLVSHTRYHAALIAARYRLASERIQIIPLGIRLPSPPAPSMGASPEDGTVRILYVSRLEARKGTLTLLKAIPAVLRQMPNVRFDFVGDDRPHAPGGVRFAEFFAREFPECVPKVCFLGHVSNAELASHYCRCDVFAVPSNYESFGLVYVEAMAYGKPVIGGNAGGVPEVIEHGVTGYLVAPGDHNELAQRIVELCKDRALRERMGLAARHQAHTRFSREQMAARTEEFYGSFCPITPGASARRQ